MQDDTKSTTTIHDLTKGVTDAAFLVDPERIIREFNRPFTKLHVVDRKSLRKVTGSLCRDFVNMEICEKNCVVKQVIESNGSVRLDEVSGTTQAGEKLRLIVSAVPIRNEVGEIVSVLEMHRDVTDEAQIHEKYKILLEKEKRAKEELERLVEERTKELREALQELKSAESRLVQSEKMSSLGQMVAGIAHELNNPINFIVGNIESVQIYFEDVMAAVAQLRAICERDRSNSSDVASIFEEKDIDYINEDLPKVIGSIRNGGERAAEIISGLRTFSRLDEAELKESNLEEGLDMTLTLLRNEYKDRIEIHRDYAELPAVLCHANQVNQVFMNLLFNAMQAVEGEGHIWIRTFEDEENAFIEIKDSGCGMSDELKGKIFDPFFTTKDVGKGTGLGLSISFGIIEKHGGEIKVDSKVGEGSTFRIRLPRRTDL